MFDPWQFPDSIVAPDGHQSLLYERLGEMAQGSPLSGMCSWIRNDGLSIKLHDRCGGPAIWSSDSQQVAFPIWTRFSFYDQQIAVLHTGLRELILFKRGFSVLDMQAFDGKTVTGVDSPIFNPTPVTFIAETEAIKRVFRL